MRLVRLPEILAAFDHDAAIALVAEGFRQFSAGRAQVTAVGYLEFASPPGDCHVKGGYLEGDDVFVIKLVSTFRVRANDATSQSDGILAVFSARTGEMLAVLHDEGKLSDYRTAMAGAVSARAIARPGTRSLGIVGAGTQAHLQAEAICRVLDIDEVFLWARNPSRADARAKQLGDKATALSDLAELCARSELIVTTTSSRQALLSVDMIRPGARIIALGADSPGKQELDPAILAHARVIVDSREQCTDHGESSWAIRAGWLSSAALIELGSLLAAPIVFGHDETVVVDLTGVAIQDHAIAKSVWSRLDLPYTEAC